MRRVSCVSASDTRPALPTMPSNIPRYRISITYREVYDMLAWQRHTQIFKCITLFERRAKLNTATRRSGFGLGTRALPSVVIQFVPYCRRRRSHRRLRRRISCVRGSTFILFLILFSVQFSSAVKLFGATISLSC